MLHSQNSAFDTSKLSGFPVGEVQTGLPILLRAVGTSIGEIISDDGGSRLPAWPSEYFVGAAFRQGFRSALAEPDAPGAGRRL